MISIRDLRVDYDDLCAVSDLTLEVEPGEVCGLIGPNGAGKTTTMRTLLGLIEPTYGEIDIMGIDAFEEPEEVGRLVGFMPDFPPIYDDLLVWEFIDLFAASYQIPRGNRPELIDRYLEIVGLFDKREAPTIGLSRGMRQRLMLAKTLVPNPQVLLLDEPANGVDPQGRIDLKNILKRLASEGKTILISSHILAEMDEFCTSVAIMERGRLVESGRIEDVRARIVGDSALAIEILGDPEVCLRMLSGDPRAGTVQQDHGTLVFRYQGGAEEASELLAQLVSVGVRVASFTRRKDNLEELFLKVGARELS